MGLIINQLADWGPRILLRLISLARRVLLPNQDQWLWFALACALTLVWLLGIKRVREWICRLSGLARKIMIYALIAATLMEIWREVPDFIKWGVVLGGGVLLIMAIVSIIPVVMTLYSFVSGSLSTWGKTASDLLNTQMKFSWSKSVMTALLITAVFNCRWLSNPGNDYFSSVASSVFGLIVLTLMILAKFGYFPVSPFWEKPKKEKQDAKSAKKDAKQEQGADKVEQDQNAPEKKPAKAKPEKSAETSPETPAPTGIRLKTCPHCGKEAVGTRFCGLCGQDASAPTASQARQAPKPVQPTPPQRRQAPVSIWDI